MSKIGTLSGSSHRSAGCTVTPRHPDGRFRSDFGMGSPAEALREILRAYPEPWKVVCVSTPQTIYTDIRGRTNANLRPEDALLRRLQMRGRLA